MSQLADSVILLLALLLLIGVFSTKFSTRFGMPALVLFIAAGMILSHFIYFNNASFTQIAGIFALIVILFEGGMQTRMKDIRPIIIPALSLSTIGVLLTTGIVGLFAKLSLLFAKFSFREKTLISWAGLRGAVPIVLATYPLLAGFPQGRLFFNVVFFVVLTSAVIQGTTISPLASRLKLVGKDRPALSLMELVALGKTNSEFNHIRIEEHMPIAHKQISALELPNDILFTAIIRSKQIVAPHGNTVIEPGDILYVLNPKNKREEMQSLFSGDLR